MTTEQKRGFPLIPVLVGLGAIVLIATVVLTFEGGGDEFGEPVVTGESLPRLPDSGSDPGLGSMAPEVEGADFDGTPVSITHGDSAKVVVFLAHWCPHCQREVPIVQDWLDGDPLPEGVEFISVSTSISRTRENYPPSAWLDREGWTPPVIVDDAAGSVSGAYGLNAFPFWVFLAEDGTVLARVTGGISPADLDIAVSTLVAASAE